MSLNYSVSASFLYAQDLGAQIEITQYFLDCTMNRRCLQLTLQILLGNSIRADDRLNERHTNGSIVRAK